MDFLNSLDFICKDIGMPAYMGLACGVVVALFATSVIQLIDMWVQKEKKWIWFVIFAFTLVGGVALLYFGLNLEVVRGSLIFLAWTMITALTCLLVLIIVFSATTWFKNGKKKPKKIREVDILENTGVKELSENQTDYQTQMQFRQDLKSGQLNNRQVPNQNYNYGAVNQQMQPNRDIQNQPSQYQNYNQQPQMQTAQGYAQQTRQPNQMSQQGFNQQQMQQGFYQQNRQPNQMPQNGFNQQQMQQSYPQQNRQQNQMPQNGFNQQQRMQNSQQNRQQPNSIAISQPRGGASGYLGPADAERMFRQNNQNQGRR